MKTFFNLIVLGLLLVAKGREAFGEGATSAPATQGGSRIELTSPKDWEVFQRGEKNSAVVRIAGNVDAVERRKLKVEVQVFATLHVEQVGAIMAAETELITGNPRLGADGKFEVSLPLSATEKGWYSVEVKVMDGENTVGEVEIKHVGVGEVFVVGGQSNSTNYGEVKTKTQTGMVTVFDGKEWTVAADPLPGVDGKGGSPWCAFGDALAERLHVPVGIVPVGRGSTSVRQWLPKGDAVTIEPSRDYGLKKLADGTWQSEGLLFDRMVERMKQLGPNGFRAMLWHQGESDAHQTGGHTLPGAQYRTMLERVIQESRKEAGWEVPWFVATASWGSPETPADPDIRAAQQGVVTDGLALAGPDTDTLLGENRQKNGTGVHMSAVGLKAHGELWAGVVGKWLDTLNAK